MRISFKSFLANLSYQISHGFTFSTDPSISSAVTYNLTGTITLNGNAGGGAVTATSANSSCVTVSSTTTGTVTVKCSNYSASATQITINVAETTKYASGTCTCNVTTAKATPTLTLSAESVVLTSANPSATVTVTTNSTGEISAISGDTDMTIISLSEKNITIEPSGHGAADITVSIKETSNFTAGSKIISVDTSLGPINLLKGGRNIRTLANMFTTNVAAKYFKTGDYFDITFPSQIDLDYGYSIPANSTWRAVCIGINHNSGLELFNAGHFCICRDTNNNEITFIYKRAVEANVYDNKWNESHIKTWLNETFFNALPSDLRAVITECKKYTDNTGSNNHSEESITATTQKIWLLSEFEVFGSTRFANPYEQNKQLQYEYFNNGNVTRHVMHCDINCADYWMFRSPDDVYTDPRYRGFCGAQEEGVPASGGVRAAGINPCFTIGGWYW